ncbi:MAG: hypothetical protein FWC67_02870 [Defluviitaleaceae bacterium]|nr:hypothetical protein [Defluviitaleaceae bacterium]
MISVQAVSGENFEAVLRLRASSFVAPVDYSLAQAYLSLQSAITKGTDPKWCERPFAVLSGDEVVGFCMMAFEDGEDLDAQGEIFWISRVIFSW